MADAEVDFWNNRFSSDEYIYGDEANEYFKQKLLMITPGKILLPAEGEGRNAVFAAKSGWDTYAFDQSLSGKRKAELLARRNGVKILYNVANMADADYPENSFDVIALIYAHLPSAVRANYHKKLTGLLKPGGKLILEAFSINHPINQATNPQAGGPKDADMLYDIDILENDFPNFTFLESTETTTTLSEGQHHLGKANVVRILAVKK